MRPPDGAGALGRRSRLTDSTGGELLSRPRRPRAYAVLARVDPVPHPHERKPYHEDDGERGPQRDDRVPPIDAGAFVTGGGGHCVLAGDRTYLLRELDLRERFGRLPTARGLPALEPKHSPRRRPLQDAVGGWKEREDALTLR